MPQQNSSINVSHAQDNLMKSQNDIIIEQLQELKMPVQKQTCSKVNICCSVITVLFVLAGAIALFMHAFASDEKQGD
jgi:hypothetical protein